MDCKPLMLYDITAMSEVLESVPHLKNPHLGVPLLETCQGGECLGEQTLYQGSCPWLLLGYWYIQGAILGC